jgi:GDP-4-dehydro-6-deoxy-D-mannose reductase
MVSNFARQIALIEKRKQKPIICVGNLEPVRDFTDVRDVVQAYWLSLERGKPGEVYNICSGKGNKIKKILEIILSLTSKKIKIKQEKSRFRPSDIMVLVGDNSRFCRQTGWKPKIPLEDSLRDILNYWRGNA